MSRGWFLAGFLGTLVLPVLFFVVFGLANDRWPLKNISPAPARDAAGIGLLLVLWACIFPIWRLLLRRRLLRRGRPLWLAAVPGVIGLLAPIFLGFLLALQWRLGELLAHALPWLTLTHLGLVLGGPYLLGILAGIGLAIECLRPDRVRPPPPPEIFD